MPWDEPTTIPALRQRGHINLHLEPVRDPGSDPLRASRGIIAATLISAAIILAVWVFALRLMP
jgi:hypothetical protein